MKLITLALALAVPTLAAADTLPKPVQDMECLVGTWKGGGTLAMGKDKAKVTSALDCKRTSAKYGVLCTLAMGGMPQPYAETDLFGYEPNTDTYHWFSVTNAGETHDHAAKLAAGSSKIQWVYTGTQDGKPFKEVVDMEFAKDGKALTVRSESFVAGASVAVLDGKVAK